MLKLLRINKVENIDFGFYNKNTKYINIKEYFEFINDNIKYNYGYHSLNIYYVREFVKYDENNCGFGWKICSKDKFERFIFKKDEYILNREYNLYKRSEKLKRILK